MKLLSIAALSIAGLSWSQPLAEATNGAIADRVVQVLDQICVQSFPSFDTAEVQAEKAGYTLETEDEHGVRYFEGDAFELSIILTPPTNMLGLELVPAT